MNEKKLYNRKRKRLAIFASLYPLLLMILSLFDSVFSKSEGIFALTAVFAPYLFSPLLLALPVTLLRGTGLLRTVLSACLVLFGLRFCQRVFAFTRTSSDEQKREVTLLSWNMLVSNQHPDAVQRLVKEHDVAIVALQEVLWHEMHIAYDPYLFERYPYQLVHSLEDVPRDLALLSAYPIREYGSAVVDEWNIPHLLWARLDLGAGRTLLVVNVHLSAPSIFTGGCLYGTMQRDEQILAMRAFIDPLLELGEAILIVGDMNITDREPAYRTLTVDLLDSHLFIGRGSGHSWGRIVGNRLWALLRIDYLLCSSNIKPLAMKTDRSMRGSDHSVLLGHFYIP